MHVPPPPAVVRCERSLDSASPNLARRALEGYAVVRKPNYARDTITVRRGPIRSSLVPPVESFSGAWIDLLSAGAEGGSPPSSTAHLARGSRLSSLGLRTLTTR